MRIITLVKHYFTYFILLLCLLGYNTAAYSQCPTVTNPTQSFCDTQSPTIASLAATNNGGGISWYANATGGAALLSSQGLSDGEDYFADDNTGTCGTRQRVVVAVYAAPTGANFQGVCVTNLSQATPSNPQFVIAGNNLRWYTTPSGGTPISNSTILTDNTIYYISQTNPDTLCETSRLQLFVNVGLVPIPTGTAVQEFCNVGGSPPTVADLAASGNNNWYATSTFGIPLNPGTPLVNGQFYYATTVDPPCESSDRLQVLVNIYEPNNAGNDGNRSICFSQIPTTAPFNLFNLLGGTPNNTGVWSGPIATTNGSQGTLNPSTMTVAGSPYVFTYTVSSAICAADTSTVTIVINPTPTVTLNSPTVCQGTSATVTAAVTPAGTYNYVWTVPPGAANPGNVSTFTTATAGIYSVIATNTSTGCASQSVQTTVIINPRPTVTVISPPICQGTSATVTATPNPSGTYTYLWTVPSGATNPGNVATFTTTTAGVYSVVITNPTTNCSSLPAQTTGVINPIPTVTVTSPPVCQGTAATVTATSNPTGAYNYVWTVPAGATNPGNVATFTTNIAGVYSVIATNSATTCPSQPAQTTVIINPRPIVTVTSPPVCQGTAATVTATPNPAGTYTYIWTVPAGATNPGNVATFTTTTPGVYSVIATNPATTCPSLPSQTTVVINPRPTVTVTSPPVCQGASATVTATPNPAGTYTYVWTVPSGATNPGNVATFTTTTPGVYSVIATNTSTTCPSLPAQTTVVFNPVPTVTVTSPPVCQGTSATVTATAIPAGTYTYVWTVPAGATNPGNVATFTTAIAGVYSVIITNPTTTCPSQPAQTTVIINPRPTVTVTSLPVCQGMPATVTATTIPSGTYTYAWTVPTGATNPGNVATFTTTTAGVYSVIVTNPATSCPSLPAQTTVVINPVPTVTVTSPPVCQGTAATVTATATPSGTYTYTWTVPTGATNPGNVATFTTTTAGVYSVIVTSPTTTCPSQPAQTTVVINPIPTVTVTSTPVCQGAPSTVTATPNPSGTYTYVWTVPTGAANPGNVATFTTTTPGIYSVIVTNASSTCPSQPSQTTVLINPRPTVTVTSPPVCQGTPATVTAIPNPAGTYSYVWTVPSGANNPGNVATFTTTTAGVYTVIATNAATTCPSQPSQTTVVINPTPTVTVASTPVCQGTPSTVTATATPAGTYTYTWTVPSGASNPGNVATFTTTIAGVYSVTIINPSTNCPSQPAQTTVVINPVPIVTVTAQSVCQGTPATVTATPNPAGTYNYVWTVPAGVTNPGNVTTFTTNTAGVYSVIITNPTTTCPSQPAQGTVVISPIPTVTVSSAPVCVGTPATVTATPNPAGTYNYVWTFPVGAANPGNVATFTTTTPGVYSVTVTNTSTTCPSLPAQATVVINPVPDAGTNGNLNICSNENPVDLFLSLGGAPQAGGTWSPLLSSGTGVFDPVADVSGIYTYTIRTAPCVNDTATVTVNVIEGPQAGNDGELIICVNNPPQDLFIELGPGTQTGGTWSPAMASGTGVFNPAIDPQGDYTYTLTGTTPCSNDDAVITVIVNPIPDAGTNGTKAFCSNGTSEDLFLSLGGTPQAGGTWTPALASGTGVFDPAVDPAGSYIYTVGGTCITQSTATVIVSIITAPNSGGTGQTLTICANVTSLDLTTGLNGTQGTGTWNDDDASGALTANIFNPSTAGVGTYHFTYTVVGTAPCANATSTVTVVVNPLPKAGTAVAPPSVCTSVGTIDLNTLLTGQDAGGTWSHSTPVDISNFAPGTYTYTYSVTNSCGTDTENVQFVVLPNPVLTTTNVTSSQACVGTNVVVNLVGMTDGTYSLTYSLSGNNTLANQTATVTISGGTGSFIIPAANVPNTGSTTITFNTIQNTTSTCQVALTNIIATITISPIVQIDNANITVSSICLGSAATVVITNAVNLPDGIYQFDYAITSGTPATGNSGNVTIAAGAGQFAVPASVFGAIGNYTITISGISITSGCSNTTEDANVTFSVVSPLSAGTFSGIQIVCPSVGVFNLGTLLTGASAGGVWTDSASAVVVSPVNIINFAAGTYSYTYTVSNACGTDSEEVQFTVLAAPILTTVNVTVPQSCTGTDATINLSGMADGTYTLNFDLSGSNTLPGQSVVVTITGGVGSFVIPTASIPNAGTTVITFTSIVNNTTTCSTTLTNVSKQLIIKPLADVDSTNLTVANSCLGNDVIVSIAGAGGLPDGVYQFNYSIPTAIPSTGNSGNVTITAGAGQFTVPGGSFPSAGNYTLTVTGILATGGCANPNENATVNFTINAVPNTNGAMVTAQPTCINVGSLITISGATGLPDGTYSLTYQLSGANTATSTITVTFTGGAATFTISGIDIVNNGDTTLTITQLTSTVSTCGLTANVFTPVTFSVVSLPMPVLITDGYQFCGSDVPAPTVADLSANIVGTPTMVWYDAPSAGTAYNPADLLVDGTTYYGAEVSVNGCESSRLQVQVDLSFCDIVIPDGFSPNNDGINDTFEIPNLALVYPNFKMEIYNRYGNLIYKGNKNVPNFDGTTTEAGLKLGNNLLPTGVYFYILEFNDGTRKPVQGRLYLNR